MAKLVLNMDAAQQDFFEDTAMIGIVSAEQGYRFCWIVNNHFGYDFKNYPEQEVVRQRKDGTQFYFPTYQYDLDNSCYKYLLYKLKSGPESLLPETKHLDYLWLVQTSDSMHDAHFILGELRKIREVQLCQMLVAEQVKKSLNNLLL
jgi:hypothetical protein